MILKPAFYIYDNYSIADFLILQGRLMCDIGLSDKIVIIDKTIMESYQKISHDYTQPLIYSSNYVVIKLLYIKSYGEYWDFLNHGMSAEIRCKLKNGSFLSKPSLKNYILFKVINE